MADVVSKGLSTLVRGAPALTIQVIRKEKRVRVARIDLVGGGCRIKNITNYLAEQLNVPVALGAAAEQAVENHVGPDRRGRVCPSALAFALRATGERPVVADRLPHRRLHVRRPASAHAPARAGDGHRRRGARGGCCSSTWWSSTQVINAREADIDQQFCDITKKVVGREICEPTVAKSVISQPASELGTFALPQRSAFGVAAELSSLVPKELEVVALGDGESPRTARGSSARRRASTRSISW